ncbi:hypothetical protein MES5069_190059 [Mesorhizobium escarrei]|uniref:Uncharacterized protein n=1 Tax=Mesorhizobium escarrei TaxID=666018 RepID=A0ABM9DN73_9HYPH|nr:hypothetical protein MES5069_190059 [Mesorhizobium escarrei]
MGSRPIASVHLASSRPFRGNFLVRSTAWHSFPRPTWVLLPALLKPELKVFGSVHGATVSNPLASDERITIPSGLEC